MTSLVQRAWQDIQRYGGAALELPVAVFIGGFGGYWLDQTLRISPWMTIIGFFVGAAAGFRGIYRLILSEAEGEKKRGQR